MNDEGGRGLRQKLLPLTAVAAIIAVVGASACSAFRAERAGEASFWLLAGGPTLALAPLALWRARRDGVLGEWMRPRGGDFTLGFLVAAALFGAAHVFTKVVARDGSPRAIWLARLYLQLGDPNLLRAHPTLLLLGLIAVAAAEEIVWRGLVTSLLEEWLGSRIAWVAGAVAYALAYVPTMASLAVPSGPNPVLPIAALGAGLVWGAMARRSGRLTPGIVSHALFDWCVVAMFRLWGQSL
ncbi:MAG TPA: CPBP family intramembrane glutamic endopeptidase [Polyangiaceae bacterium]|jgi:membrane protease YdiL (CAAX protease family)